MEILKPSTMDRGKEIAERVLDEVAGCLTSLDFIAAPLNAYLEVRAGDLGQDAGYRERVVEYCTPEGVNKYDEAML